jgi:energy-coupling factor transporter ATP-binding protein EcfA2
MTSSRVRLDRRPLLDTAPDADLFVGRSDELARLRRSVDLDLNAAVVGERGSGKSSLLRHLAWTLRRERSTEAPAEPLLITAAGTTAPAALLRQMLRRVAGDEAAVVAEVAGTGPAALLDRLSGVLPERAVVLVDDVTAELGRALFGALRDEVWRLGATWVVAVADEQAGALLRPPADVFFETVVRLGPLTADEVSEVLRRRGVEVPPHEAHILARLARGVPRRLVDLARAVVVDGRPVAALEAEHATRDQALQTVSPPARDLAQVLADLGPAGPSDRAVQARMGVTRPRLVALFGELSDAGVVAELPPDRSAGTPGRPKTRYALVTDGDARVRNVGGPRDSALDDH